MFLGCLAIFLGLLEKHYRFRTLKLDFVRIFYFSVSRNNLESSVLSFLTFWDPIFETREHLGKPFWPLGTPWEAILASREHLGRPFWHLGTNLGAILAPRDHPGGPWEQQDGHSVANNRIFVDFGMVLGLVSVSFWIQNV